MFRKKILKIWFFKFISHFIRDKEKRKLWCHNKISSDSILFPGNSYAITPFFYDPNTTVIGKYVSIATEVRLGCGDHCMTGVSTSPKLDPFKKIGHPKPAPVIVDHDVWIGTGAFIKPGVHIGIGAVIGAKSVVTKDVPPYAIVAGVPARVIRYRFDSETIKNLLRSEWWNIPRKELEELPYEDPLKFLKALSFKKEHQEIHS